MGQGADPREARSPPRAAPARPPKLQAAWKEDMIGRPYPLSTATACAFMATSSPPLAAPSSTSASTRRSKLGASAGVRSETASTSAAAPTRRRLPKRETRAPTSGMATSAPAAAPSRATPSKPSPRPSRSFMAGILTTHVPITAPLVKNTASTASRGTRSEDGPFINLPVGAVREPAHIRHRQPKNQYPCRRRARRRGRRRRGPRPCPPGRAPGWRRGLCPPGRVGPGSARR